METYLNKPSVVTPRLTEIETFSDDRPARPRHNTSRRLQREVGGGYWTTTMSLLALDLIGILGVAGAVKGLSLAVGGTVLDVPSNGWVTVYSAASVLLPVAFGMAGLYRVVDTHPAQELRRMFVVCLTISAAAALTAFFLAPSQVVTLATLGGLAAIVLPSCRALGRIILARTDWWGVPTIVLGDKKHRERVVQTLNRWPEMGFRPVASLREKQVTTNGNSLRSAGSECALNIAQEHQVPYAIIAMPTLSHAERARMITRVSRFYERLFVVPECLGPAALWTARSSSQGLLGYGFERPRQSSAARLAKRCIDVVAATMGMVLLAPLFSAIAALISVDSPGPVFFKQRRMGLDGRCFTVFKFRTMYTDAEAKLQEILDGDPGLKAEYDRYHKLEDDPRVTRVGKWLRRLSLDELPQLWNVLRGDMSLVGPRAYMPSELPRMNGLSRTVLQCPPGLTGLWQVSGRNNLDFSTRVDLDVHYMQHWTLWLDIYILIRTIPVVVTGDGAK